MAIEDVMLGCNNLFKLHFPIKEMKALKKGGFLRKYIPLFNAGLILLALLTSSLLPVFGEDLSINENNQKENLIEIHQVNALTGSSAM